MNRDRANAAEVAALVRRLLADQRQRCQRGEALRVEHYLQQEPALADHPDALLDLIYQEMMLREQQGETPTLEEYLTRFPRLTEQLKVQFELEKALAPDSLLGGSRGPTAVGPAAGLPPPTATAPTAAQTVAGHEILGILGHGGMGVVYKARQLKLNRVVALKMILAGPHAGSEEHTRFRIEAEAIARLQHPNIVQIFEVGEDQGRPYLCLEYADGGSLAQQLRGQPQPADDAARLVAVLAGAMQHAHQLGIVHRDLKPANVLLKKISGESTEDAESGLPTTREPGGVTRKPSVAARPPAGPRPAAGRSGERALAGSGVRGRNSSPSGIGAALAVFSAGEFLPKVTDFGLAKLVQERGSGPTVSGDFLGTPSYTAPEQAAGRLHEIGPCTDIYALGAILYECLTGRPPFHGASPVETLFQVRYEEPVPPSRLCKLPRDLEVICLKCLRKEPRNRYASAADLGDDLHRYLARQPIQARPVGRAERLVKWARRHPTVATLSTVAALAVLALLVGGWWSAATLERAAEQERASAKKAEASFDQALAAVEQMLTSVATSDLADVPQAEPVREKLLLQAQEFYRKFLDERGDEPKLRHLVGRAHGRLGDIHESLARHDAARREYRRGIELLSAAADDAGHDLARRRELARCRHQLGALENKLSGLAAAEALLRQALGERRRLAEQTQLAADRQAVAATHNMLGATLAKLNRKEEAKAEYAEAARLLEALGDAHPGEPEYRRDLARTLNNLGKVSTPADGKKHLARAIAIQQKLRAGSNDAPAYRRELARSLNNLAVLLRLAEDRKGATEKYDEALELLKNLVLYFPMVPAYRNELATLYSNVGQFNMDIGQLKLAKWYFEYALYEGQQTVAVAPDVADYRHKLAGQHVSLATLFEKQKRVDAALPHCREALAILEKLLAVQPEREEYLTDFDLALDRLATLLYGRGLTWPAPCAAAQLVGHAASPSAPGGLAALAARPGRADFVEALAAQQRRTRVSDHATDAGRDRAYKFHQARAQIYLQLGDHAAVVKDAERLPALLPRKGLGCLLAAQLLAGCVPQARREGRPGLEEVYADRCLKLIQRAFESGWDNIDMLRTSPGFAPVRQRGDFQKLLEDLRKNKTGTG
jgi:serine/threonine protein kinase